MRKKKNSLELKNMRKKKNSLELKLLKNIRFNKLIQ